MIYISIFKGVCESFESELVEMDGERDHVHLLVNYPPKISISKLVNSLKGASSRVMRKDEKRLRRIYWKGVLWSPSYFAASCGGNTLRNKTHRINGFRRYALYPRPEDRGFTACWITIINTKVISVKYIIIFIALIYLAQYSSHYEYYTK